MKMAFDLNSFKNTELKSDAVEPQAAKFPSFSNQVFDKPCIAFDSYGNGWIIDPFEGTMQLLRSEKVIK
jgi:hypothetical protein